jgi:hypothetical protein
VLTGSTIRETFLRFVFFYKFTHILCICFAFLLEFSLKLTKTFVFRRKTLKFWSKKLKFCDASLRFKYNNLRFTNGSLRFNIESLRFEVGKLRVRVKKIGVNSRKLGVRFKNLRVSIENLGGNLLNFINSTEETADILVVSRFISYIFVRMSVISYQNVASPAVC